MLALLLYQLTRGFVSSRPVSVAIATIAAQPATLCAYALWGGIKELVAAATLPLVAALAGGRRGALGGGLDGARGKRVLLAAVDLELHRGEVVVVLGPNGAGKSTLLSVLAGLLPYRSGTVRLNGRVAAALQAPALARRSVRANLHLAMGWWGCRAPSATGARTRR